MQTTELDEILAVVRKVRDEKHPNLDLAFLEQVVRTEEAEADSPSKAIRAIEKAMEEAIARVGD